MIGPCVGPIGPIGVHESHALIHQSQIVGRDIGDERPFLDFRASSTN